MPFEIFSLSPANAHANGGAKPVILHTRRAGNYQQDIIEHLQAQL